MQLDTGTQTMEARHPVAGPTAKFKSAKASIAMSADRQAAESPGTEGDQEKCPVIRANQILFAAGAPGRTRVVYF